MAEAPADRMAREELWGHLTEAPDIQEKIRIFGQMIPQDVETIVDVGCGDGAITNALGARWRITGVDSSATALSHVTVPSVHADARALPLPDAAFDLAMSSQMLEHLDDATYTAAMAELQRVTRQHLLISVPYREDLGMRMVRCPACGHWQHVWGHVRRFTIDSLLRDLPAFQPVDVRVFGDLQEPAWPKAALGLVHRVFRGSYSSAGQHPQCEACGNADFSGIRPFPPYSGNAKAVIDRVTRRPRLPFWLAMVLTRKPA